MENRSVKSVQTRREQRRGEVWGMNGNERAQGGGGE